MKKFLFGLVAAVIISTVFMSAGTITRNSGTIASSDYNACLTVTGSGATTWDSLTGPDTSTFYLQIKGSKDVLTIQNEIDEYGSGTLAGTIVISGCINYHGTSSTWYETSGLQWVQLDSHTIVDGDAVDTVPLQRSDYRYYRIQIINSAATTEARFRTHILVRGNK